MKSLGFLLEFKCFYVAIFYSWLSILCQKCIFFSALQVSDKWRYIIKHICEIVAFKAKIFNIKETAGLKRRVIDYIIFYIFCITRLFVW